jgi:hypothetical protein
MRENALYCNFYMASGLCMTWSSVVDSQTYFCPPTFEMICSGKTGLHTFKFNKSGQLYGMILDNQVRWSVDLRNLCSADRIQWRIRYFMVPHMYNCGSISGFLGQHV